MKDRMVGVFMVVLVVLNALGVVSAVSLSTIEIPNSNALEADSVSKIAETTVTGDVTKPWPLNKLGEETYKTPVRSTETRQETAQKPNPTSRNNEDKWDLNDTSEWGRLAYLDGNKTRLIVGVSNETPENRLVMERIAERRQARIVNTVSIGSVVRAVVVELPLTQITSFAEQVREMGLASYIEPNMKVQAQLVPNDPYWESQWGPQKIEANWAWNTTTGSHTVSVAVVDTGIDYYHPDLAANYVPLGYDWANLDPEPMDDHGHGTHCAGIIGATLNNSVGVAGLAQVRIMAEKVLDNTGWGLADWLASGIAHAVDQGARIISISLGGYGNSDIIHEAIEYAYDAGALVIAAAGNRGANTKPYPAGYDEVVAVAATNQDDIAAQFSNWGNWIELSAPGVSICSTVPGGYESWSGTSMACPHVSGVAALVWSLYPEANRDWVRMRLRTTTDDLGDQGFDVHYGYGRVNARKAFEQALPSHELMAESWDTPTYVEPGTPGIINATVINFGEHDETGITVQLLANDTIVTSRIIDLLPKTTSATLSLEWNPTVEGSYNVTVYVAPVAEEADSRNNALSKRIYVGFPVKVFVLRSAGSLIEEIIANWQVLNDEWSRFGHKMIYIDYTTLNKENITYADLVATDADVLLISCACMSMLGWEFSDTEIDAIKRYTYEGHGLIVTSGTLYYGVPNNNKLGPLFGLSETVRWDFAQTGLLNLEASHPIFANVPNPLVFSTVGTAIPEDMRWDSDELEGGEYLALGQVEESAIVTYRGLVYISPMLEIIPAYYSDHLQLFYNAITWSRYQRPEHEIVVSLDEPRHIEPGESTLLNATACNLGSNNEIDVDLCLLIDGAVVNATTIPELVVNTSYTIRYLWTPIIEKGYNVTAYAQPVPNEEYRGNNVVTVSIRAHYVISRVAVLSSIDVPPYFVGRWSNDYQLLVNALNARDFYAQVVTNEDLTHGILRFFDLFVMVGNVPSEAAIPYVVDYWSTGGGLLAFDSSVCFLCYAGILPPESAGDCGYHRYWDYGTQNQARISTAHPITEEYKIDQVIYGAPFAAEYWADAIANSGSCPYYSVLVEDLARPNLAYVSALEPLASGKVVHVWDYLHWRNLNLQSMILNAIKWASAPHLEHDLGASLIVPSSLELGNTALLKAIVTNRGTNSESNVTLRLLINGTEVSLLMIPELQVGESRPYNYSWTPTRTGTYNITICALPIAGEGYIANNVMTKMTGVFCYTRLYCAHEWVGGGVPKGWHADDFSWEYPLPFDFPFYGAKYRTVYISSNGLITFLGPDDSFSDSMQALAEKVAVAPAWNDWITSWRLFDISMWQNTTHISVQWFVRSVGTDNAAGFEVILNATGAIRFNYDFCNGTVSATVGISDGQGHVLAEDLSNLNCINTILFVPFWVKGDIEIVGVEPSASEVLVGRFVNVTANVENQGNLTGSFTITAYASFQGNSTETTHMESLDGTRIFLNPSNNVFNARTVFLGYRFNITVKVEDVIDLAAWQFGLYYKDSIIRVARWFEPAWDSAYVFYGRTTSPLPLPPEVSYHHDQTRGVGIVTVASSLFPPEQNSFKGNGTLCILEFEILYVPPSEEAVSCSLTVDNSFTYLLNSEANEIPVVKENGYYALGWVSSLLPPPGSLMIGTISVTHLRPSERRQLTFAWNTTNMILGEYRIWAEVGKILGKIYVSDNKYVDGIVKVKKPPIARFTYSPEYPEPNRIVAFNASASTPGGGMIISYLWNFGDGTMTITADTVITHTYNFSQTFNVTLTITDTDDLTNSTYRLLYVFNRDIVMISITPSTSQTYVGHTIAINITIRNQGDLAGTSNLTLYNDFTDDEVIGVQQFLTLLPNQSLTMTFLWDTTGMNPNMYNLTGFVTPIRGETDLSDNMLFISVQVKMLGDVNGDSKVDLKDYYSVATSYGETSGRPRWDPEADMNDDGKIDLKDLYVVAKSYGKSC